MKKVNVTTLKAQLSKYLRFVRAGTDLMVLDRNLPIARVSRLPKAEASAMHEFTVSVATRDMSEIEKTLPPLPSSAGQSDSLSILMEERSR